MSLIYDVKSTLTQTALDAFCQKYHIPDVVHPGLPTPNKSIHDSPVGKIGVYTSFLLLPPLRSLTLTSYAAFTVMFQPLGCSVANGSFFLYSSCGSYHGANRRRQIEEGQVSLLESIEGRVIPLAGGNKHGGQNDNVEVDGPHNLNEEGSDAEQENRPEGDDRKAASGASGSNIPPKKLKEDHDISGDAGASIAATTVPFVTSFVTVTPKREGSGHTDLFAGLIFKLQLREPFSDFASLSTAGPNSAGPSNPRGTELSADTFYVSQEMDFETLQQIYIPKWNAINDSVLDDPEGYTQDIVFMLGEGLNEGIDTWLFVSMRLMSEGMDDKGLRFVHYL
uniref:Uncharacterized protein n=1 Tax=Tanacetum cinerariifolium TaxID=118510 RepID=A0A6L2JIS6_TANCI|nr:hypothetical protein [Tanacetum cinerariifolium]